MSVSNFKKTEISAQICGIGNDTKTQYVFCMKLKEEALWLIMQAPEKFRFQDLNNKVIEKLAN